MYRVPTGYREVTRRLPGRVPTVCIFAENAPYRTSKKVSARSSARPAAALRDLAARRALLREVVGSQDVRLRRAARPRAPLQLPQSLPNLLPFVAFQGSFFFPIILQTILQLVLQHLNKKSVND